MNRLKKPVIYIRNKLWQAFVMPDRIHELETILDLVERHSYCTMTMEDLTTRLTAGDPFGKCCILRVDVDSDPDYCLEFARVFSQRNMAATFYFRLCTLKKSTIESLLKQGFEVGYHFEELATVAKRKGMTSKAEAISAIDDMRLEFRKNIEKYKDVAGAYPKTVASHGDYANTKLDITNCPLIDDSIRSDYGIICEAYDEMIISKITNNFIDQGPPDWWKPIDIANMLAQGADDSLQRVLLHPSQWRSSLRWGTYLVLGRAISGALYWVRRTIRAPASPRGR